MRWCRGRFFVATQDARGQRIALPEYVDDAWPIWHGVPLGPAEMDPMEIEELMDWRERARRRAEPPKNSHK